MLRRVHRVPAALAALLVIAALGSIAWSVAVPALNGPDEDTHIAYVQRIVETGEPPQDVEEGAPAFSSELRAAEYWSGLYQTMNRTQVKPHLSEVEREAFDRAVREGAPGGRRDDGQGFSSAAKNPPLYYLYAAAPYLVGYEGDFFLRVQLMRLAGVPLLLLVVTASWLLVAELLPRPYWGRVLGAGVVALHPGLGAASASVNPDIMLAAVWSAFLVVAVRTVKRGPTGRRAILLGLLCAASALTQPRGLGIVLPALVALGLAVVRHPVPWRTAARFGATTTGLAVLGFFAYYALTSVYGAAETSGQLQGAVAGGLNLRQFSSYLWQFYFPRLPFMDFTIGPPYGFTQVYVNSFVGIFANQDVYFPGSVYPRLRTLALQGLGALAVCLILRRDGLRRHWPELAVLVAAALALIGVLHVASYRALLSNGGTDPVIVGRYLLPLMGLFALAVALVCTTMRERWGQVVGAAVLATVALLQLGAIGVAVTRFYGG